MMKGIKEDHHFSALKDYLYQLYKDQALCDVSFITKNGKTVLAHKLIVAAFSGAVRTEVERWKDFTQVSLVVGCEDTVLEGILEFIYTGEVTVSHELLPHFHQESRGLQIPLLKNYLNSKYKAKKQTKFTAKSSSTKSGKTTANREWEMTVVSSLKKINEKPGRISLRDRNELKKSYVKYDNQDFIWDDGNDDDDGEDSRGVDIDDRHVKPTYNRNEFNDIKPDEKLLAWPVVKLERIDVSDFNIQALRNRRPKDNKYSRESLSELARQKRKRKCPSIPIAKHSVDKVKQSMKMFKRRKLTVSMAVNIVKQYKTKYSLVVGNSSGYSCKICKFSNKLAAAVKFHAKRHKQKIRCDTMSNAVHSKKEKFNRIKEKISRFECFICNRKYNLIRSLANHLIKHHQYSYEKTQKLTGYPKFFVFQTKTEAKCNDCSDWFDNLTELQDHCRLVHKNKKPKLDLCCIEEGCGQRFENLTSLKEHINILHKQKTKKKKSFIGSRIRPHQNGVQSQSDIEMSNTRNLHRKRQNYKYKVYLPSKFYKCSKCKKPTIFRNKKLFQKHQDLRHNKTFITKQLESQMIREKYLRLNYPRKKDFSKISPDSLSFISELNSAEQEIANLSIVQSAIQSSTVTKSVSNAASSYEDTMQEILIKSPSTKPASSQQSNTQVETTLSALQLSKQTGDDVILDIANFDLEDIVINQQTSAKKDKKFICCKCGKSFHFYGQLGLHFKKNHGSYPLQQRKIYSKIQRHIKSCRYVCFRKFPVTDVSKEKLATQTSKSLTCEVCHKVYRFSRSLAKHLQRNHSYTFEEAQNVTGYPSFLVSASITFSRVKCIDCPQTFAETSSLRRHLKVAHKYTQGQVKEATSELTFSHDSSVVKPRKVEMHIKCKKCAKSFHTTNALDCHTVRTHGIPCKYCDKSLANKLALKRHVKKEHPEHLNEFTKMNVSMKIKDPQSGDVDQGSDDFKTRIEQKIYQCEKCEFLTKKLNELISHVIDVHPEIEYPCPVCGFTLRSKISLENHIRLKHSEGQMKNVCSFCQKGFPRKSILILHQFKQHGIDHPDIKVYMA